MEQQYAGVAGVGLIAGLVEVCKRVGLPIVWAPALSLLLGIALSVGYEWVTVPNTREVWFNAVIVGLGLGLAASGLYSGVKNTVERI